MSGVLDGIAEESLQERGGVLQAIRACAEMLHAVTKLHQTRIFGPVTLAREGISLLHMLDPELLAWRCGHQSTSTITSIETYRCKGGSRPEYGFRLRSSTASAKSRSSIAEAVLHLPSARLSRSDTKSLQFYTTSSFQSWPKKPERQILHSKFEGIIG